jgi:hypothetical protein
MVLRVTTLVDLEAMVFGKIELMVSETAPWEKALMDQK